MNEIKKEQLAIWGAGRNGNIAYHMYKNSYEILFYIDFDKNKWGNYLNGIPIKKPDELKNNKIKVVIALKFSSESIIEKLINKYGIRDFWIFNINEVFPEKNIKKINVEADIEKDAIILSFGGGLGNQMFQYVLYRIFEKLERKVYGDLSSYNNPQAMQFELSNVFSNAKIKICSCNAINSLIEKNIKDFDSPKNFTIYIEPTIYDIKKKKADKKILDISSGIIKGLFQTSVFSDQIKNELRQLFSFPHKVENKLSEISEKMKNQKVIGIHIRRGDYLDDNNKFFYGNICTELYYQRAIEYIHNKDKDCIFCFFSNDIEWVKEQYNIERAIYIEKKMFDYYEDWYDMYLMSLCEHNIIANSTFSWWGAWLNPNPNKIVVAPRKWVNQCKYEDIYPEDWVKM